MVSNFCKDTRGLSSFLRKFSRRCMLHGRENDRFWVPVTYWPKSFLNQTIGYKCLYSFSLLQNSLIIYQKTGFSIMEKMFKIQNFSNFLHFFTHKILTKNAKNLDFSYGCVPVFLRILEAYVLVQFSAQSVFWGGCCLWTLFKKVYWHSKMWIFLIFQKSVIFWRVEMVEDRL